MNASEHSQKCPQWCPGAFAAVAVDLADTISIVVAHPLSTAVFIVTMPHRSMGDPGPRLDPSIALPLGPVDKPPAWW